MSYAPDFAGTCGACHAALPRALGRAIGPRKLWHAVGAWGALYYKFATADHLQAQGARQLFAGRACSGLEGMA